MCPKNAKRYTCVSAITAAACGNATEAGETSTKGDEELGLEKAALDEERDTMTYNSLASPLMTIETNDAEACQAGKPEQCVELVHGVLIQVEPALVLHGSGPDQRGGEVARLTRLWGGQGEPVVKGLKKYVEESFHHRIEFVPDEDELEADARRAEVVKMLKQGDNPMSAKNLEKIENMWTIGSSWKKQLSSRSTSSMAEQIFEVGHRLCRTQPAAGRTNPLDKSRSSKARGFCVHVALCLRVVAPCIYGPSACSLS